MAADESQKQKRRWSMKQGKEAKQCTLRHWWFFCHLKKFGIGVSISKIQRQRRAPRWDCKRWFWFVCSVHWTRIISISSDSRKSHGHYIKTAGMRRTSSRHSIRSHPGQNGRCINVIDNSKVRMSRYLETSTKTQMAKIMVQYGRSGCFSWSDFVRSPFGRSGKGNSSWEKVPNWECLFANREKGLFLSVYVDDIKLAGKKENINPMWKVLNKEVDLGEPTSFLDHENLACTQRQCEISKDIVDNFRTMFESRISAGATEKLPCLENFRISSWS